MENDQKEFFSFDNWPGQLETSGTIQWDVLAMQRNIRQNRIKSHNIPNNKERMTAPAFTAWAKKVHAEEYGVMLLSPQVNSLTSISYERISRATQMDPFLRRLLANRLKGDPAVNHVLDCRVERESAWVRKKSVTVRAESVYNEALQFNTVAGIIPEGERWERQRTKTIQEVKESVKSQVKYDNEKQWGDHIKNLVQQGDLLELAKCQNTDIHEKRDDEVHPERHDRHSPSQQQPEEVG